MSVSSTVIWGGGGKGVCGPGEVPHACDISTWETEVGVQGLSGLMRACQETEKQGRGETGRKRGKKVCAEPIPRYLVLSVWGGGGA